MEVKTSVFLAAWPVQDVRSARTNRPMDDIPTAGAPDAYVRHRTSCEVVVGAKSDKEISDAVQKCLARCYTSGHTPLGEIADFLAELRLQGWPDPDIKLVEQSVRKLLAGIMQPDSEDDSGAH